MRTILIISLLFTSQLMASDSDNAKKKRLEKQIQKEIERDKKHAREQKFYKGKNYDLKDCEVNKESLDSIEVIEPIDFDMDSVYD